MISHLRNATAHLCAAGFVACNLLKTSLVLLEQSHSWFVSVAPRKTHLHAHNSEAG